MPKTYPEPQPFCDEARPPIELRAVNSSQVAAVGYDEEKRELAVTFTRGSSAVYHYPDVDKATYEAFINAESLGIFHSKHIKPLPFKKYRPEQMPAQA